jgi:transcription initiation factor TFIID subunit TAF12
MESFYFIILAIAIVILILILSVIGWMMTKNVSVQKFPGITNTCPDYWTIDVEGKCQRPDVGKMNRGTWSATADEFTDATKTPGTSEIAFNSSDNGWGVDICKKQKWAQTYGVKWDTITNSNAVC